MKAKLIFAFFATIITSVLSLNSNPSPVNKTITWSDVNNILRDLVGKPFNLENPKGFTNLNNLISTFGLSTDCKESLTDMVKGLWSGKRWAVEMVDASGKIPSGILEGTVMDFGSLEECLKIRVNKTGWNTEVEESFRGRYCMVGYDSHLLKPMYQKTPEGKNYVDAYGHPPEWAFEIIRRAAGYLNRVAFWFGTCVPSVCSEEDILKISTTISKPLGFKVSVKDCQVDEPFVWPSYSVAAASVLGCLTGLCVIGTFLDVICRWRRSDPTSTEDDHVLLRVSKAFSLLKNTETLFLGNGGGGCLGCFNGIRFLSATWIVLGHTYFYTDTWKYLKYRRLLGFEEQFNGYLPVAVLENFTVPVGSFFFMSGFLLVYTTWKQLEKNKGRLNIFMFFIHKYWRMTPALGFTLALFLCMPLVDSGPIWHSTLGPPLQQCRNFWWANMLYINNWWNTNEYCLIHTWYLAALMQFHILGILLLLISYRWPILGVLLGSLTTIACATITALIMVWHNLPMPAPGMVKDMDIIDDYNSRIYVKPFAHFVSYLIGMVVALLILKYQGRKLAPKYQLLGWTLATAGAALSVYGLYGPGESTAVRILYVIGHRIGWALGIGWMTYACATGAGGIVNRILSWSAFSSLGQLSYLTYLLHPLVIIYRNASLRERVYYGHTELVFTFLSNLVVGLFLAYAGNVAVEIPFSILEKIIFGNRSKVNLKNITYKEDPSVSTQSIKTINP